MLLMENETVTLKKEKKENQAVRTSDSLLLSLSVTSTTTCRSDAGDIFGLPA